MRSEVPRSGTPVWWKFLRKAFREVVGGGVLLCPGAVRTLTMSMSINRDPHPWPLVYVVVLSWNGCAETLACLASLRQLDYPRFRVLVVDNGSSDNTVAVVKTHFPEMEVLPLEGNRGFSGGNNYGIRYALERGAEYVFLLNNDTHVDPSALRRVVEVAEAHPDWGVLGCHLRQMDGSTYVVVGFDWIWGRTRVARALQSHGAQWIAVDAVSGCGMLVRRAVIERVGLLDEKYFLYFEDQDWCVRAREAGFGCALVSNAIVWHHVAATTLGSKQTPRALMSYYLTRNNILFMQRHASRGAFLWFLPCFLGRIMWTGIRILGGGVMAGRRNVSPRLRALLAGLWDGLLGRGGPGSWPCLDGDAGASRTGPSASGSHRSDFTERIR